MQAVIRESVHFCTAPPGPLPPRRHHEEPARSVRAPGSRPQPSLAPVITGARLSAAAEPRRKPFVKQTPHAKSWRRQEGTVGPESLRGGIFLSTCVQRQHEGRLDTYLGRPEHRSWPPGQKDQSSPGPSGAEVSARAFLRTDMGHPDQAASLRTLLRQNRTPCCCGRGLHGEGGEEAGSASPQVPSRAAPAGELCRPPTPPGGSQELLMGQGR